MSHDPLDHGRRNVVLAGSAAVALGLAGRAGAALDSTSKERRMSTLVIRNARITTLDPQQPHAQALAVQEGRIVAVGSDEEIMRGWGNEATLIDAQGRRLLPGLNDSHTHLIRGGLNYNLELRWDGLRSLGDALDMLKAQVDRTPAPQWVRVVGGFTATQFNEKRLPTLQELNDIAPDTPVFLLHLYDRALLNRAALRACGYSKDTPDPPGGQIVRDSLGNPTGLLLAKPNALILYATLAKGPKLPIEYQANSTRHFMRELNRLGITSVIDAGGGFQNYPEDYQVIEQLHRDDQLTVRIAYNLFTQNKGKEVDDFRGWSEMLQPRQGDDLLRHNGAGEMLVFSAADFELFNEPRPELPPELEPELHDVVSCWSRSVGRSASMRRTTRASPASSMCTNRSTARCRSMACTGSSTTPRPSPRATSNASVRWVAASPCSTAWPTRAKPSSSATVCRLRGTRRRSGACWPKACRSVPVPMPPAWPATTRGWRCPGW